LLSINGNFLLLYTIDFSSIGPSLYSSRAG
jgi:hypothetical protein